MPTETIPFISLNGNGQEAIKFYQDKLEAQLLFIRTYQDMKNSGAPLTIESGQENYVSHSVLQLKTGGKLMLNESPLDLKSYSIGNQMSICLQTQSLAEATTIYQALTSDTRTQIIQPMMSFPFSPGYAIVVDPFGVIFQIFTTTHEF